MTENDFEQQVLPDKIYSYGAFSFTGQQLLNNEVNMIDVIAAYGDTVAVNLVDRINDEGKAFFMIASEE
ncbi:hypothetical protein ACRYI5_00960 [Furfurilactobacillus sp. WILCCON 0119]